MKRTRYTEQQILEILGQLEAGTSISDLTRLPGVAMTTIYGWKAKYGGMTKDKTHKFRQLEAENQRLKKLVADLSLDNAMRGEVVGRKVMTPGTTSQAQTPIKKQMVTSYGTRLRSVNVGPAGCWASLGPRKDGTAREVRKTSAWSSVSAHWYRNDRDSDTGAFT